MLRDGAEPQQAALGEDWPAMVAGNDVFGDRGVEAEPLGGTIGAQIGKTARPAGGQRQARDGLARQGDIARRYGMEPGHSADQFILPIAGDAGNGHDFAFPHCKRDIT
jgi:hypothetical protein